MALVCLPFVVGAEPPLEGRPSLSEGQVRRLARDAARESRGGDSTDFVLALDRRVREESGDFDALAPAIVKREDLLVTVSAPYMTFRRRLIDALRLPEARRRLDHVAWSHVVIVDVEPHRLDAPDVAAVALTRAGTPVTPLHSALRPMTFTDGAGGRGVLHQGEVHFPVAAFSPGQTVVLTLSIASGQPIVHTFDDAALALLR
jgi:hypothetical protein